MPLPKPNAGEGHEHWMHRCMANPTMNADYPEADQRYAVCESQWARKQVSLKEGEKLK